MLYGLDGYTHRKEFVSFKDNWDYPSMWPFAKKIPLSAPETDPCPMPLFSTEMDNNQGRQALETAMKNIRFFAPQNAEGDFAMDRCNSDFDQPCSDKPISGYFSDAITGWYAGQSFIGYHLAAILAQHWLIDKACTMPARDALRQEFRILLPNLYEDLNSTPIIAAIKRANKRFRVVAEMEEFVRMGRIFGIRLALFNVTSSDPDYYVKPFTPDRVIAGSYKGISQIDPNWCVPELDSAAIGDPSSPDFYEPTYWLIGNRRIHRSHLVIFRNSEVPDILKPVYRYGGVPLPQRIMERVYAAERMENKAPQLAQARQNLNCGTAPATILSNRQRLDDHMKVWTDDQENFGVKLTNNEGEVEKLETMLANLDKVIATQHQIVAAAANVPATKLFGTTPQGFNSTGEYEEASYHEELESIRTHDLLPFIERHHLLLMASEIAPHFGLEPDTEIIVDWKAHDTPHG